jgi:hypothetical protein
MKLYRHRLLSTTYMTLALGGTALVAGAALPSMDAVLGGGGPAHAACYPCNPCAAAANPCNPCAAANPCNPCAAVIKTESPCNPCGAANPCNPCAAANPCNPCKAN